MAARPNLTVAMVAELDALQSRPAHLFECYFDDETVRATDAFGAVSWGGFSYAADGELLDFDGISETLEMRAAQVRIVLSGVDQAWISRVLSKPYITRRIVVRLAMLDSVWSVINDPAVLFDGEMRRPQIDEDPDSGTCQVTITCSHSASDVDNVSGRRTNDHLHQLLFPGDGFFKYAQQAQNQLVWNGL